MTEYLYTLHVPERAQDYLTAGRRYRVDDHIRKLLVSFPSVRSIVDDKGRNLLVNVLKSSHLGGMPWNIEIIDGESFDEAHDYGSRTSR